MWDHAAQILNEIDNRITPYEKLECMVDCIKTVTQVLSLASSKDGCGDADETLPVAIYIILKACPKRMYSNLQDDKKMLLEKGFCYTHFQSAAQTISCANQKRAASRKDYTTFSQRKNIDIEPEEKTL